MKHITPIDTTYSASCAELFTLDLLADGGSITAVLVERCFISGYGHTQLRARARGGGAGIRRHATSTSLLFLSLLLMDLQGMVGVAHVRVHVHLFEEVSEWVMLWYLTGSLSNLELWWR